MLSYLSFKCNASTLSVYNSHELTVPSRPLLIYLPPTGVRPPPCTPQIPFSPPRPPPRSHKLPLELHSLSSKIQNTSPSPPTPSSPFRVTIPSQHPSTPRFTPTLGSRHNIYPLSPPPTRLPQPHPHRRIQMHIQRHPPLTLPTPHRLLDLKSHHVSSSSTARI
jgi:hypothetical protein